MGQNDHQEPKGKKGRGETDNAKRLSQLFGRAQGAASKRVDWGDCRSDWLQAVIVAVCRVGGAVTFGASRDGGAYGLTLYLDGERQQLWFNGDADVDAELEKVFAAFESMAQ